jgi:hypothetical protein
MAQDVGHRSQTAFKTHRNTEIDTDKFYINNVSGGIAKVLFTM